MEDIQLPLPTQQTYMRWQHNNTVYVSAKTSHKDITRMKRVTFFSETQCSLL